MKVTELAPAKLNLTLEVGEKRSDGYHEVQSVMSCAALYDEVALERDVGGGITMSCDCPDLPCDETNLCLRAIGRWRRISVGCCAKTASCSACVRSGAPSPSPIPGTIANVSRWRAIRSASTMARRWRSAGS